MEVQKKRAKVKKKKAKPLDGNQYPICYLRCALVFIGTGYVEVEISKDSTSDNVRYSYLEG